MKKEIDLNHKSISEFNSYQIIRSEAKEATWDGKTKGHTKVYYDVCDNEELLDSFKTLAEAKRFAASL